MPLFWNTFCPLSSNLLIPLKFSKHFHLIFLRNFVENEKDRNHLVQGLVNMFDGGWTDQSESNIFFLHDSCWMWPSVIKENQKVSLTDKYKLLFRFPWTHCSCWDSKSALSVWLQFKKSKWIIRWWFHHTHSVSFLPWNYAFGVGHRNSSLSIPCLLCWTLSYKTHLSLPLMIFLRNRSVFYLERKLVTMNMQSSLFF